MPELSSFLQNKNRLESQWKSFENKIFCNIVILSEVTNILKFDHYQKSHKPPYFIYADLESLIEKTDGCKSNLEKWSKTNVGEHIISGLFNIYNIFI